MINKMWTNHVMYDYTLDKKLKKGLNHGNYDIQLHLVFLMVGACISLHIGNLRLGLPT